MVVGKQGHAPCSNILLFQQSLLSKVKFDDDRKTTHKDGMKSGHPQFFGYYRISNSGLGAAIEQTVTPTKIIR